MVTNASGSGLKFSKIILVLISTYISWTNIDSVKILTAKYGFSTTASLKKMNPDDSDNVQQLHSNIVAPKRIYL